MTKQRRTWRTMTAAALFTLAAGCVHSSNVLEHTEVPVPNEHVIISSNLPIRYGQVVARKEGLLLHVQVELESTTRSDQNFEYRWEWTDADGFQLGDTLSSWQPAFLGGAEHKLLTGVGPGPSAVNFRLSIRRPGS